MVDRPTLPAGPRLHVGCGNRVVPGWVNLDNSWSARLARVPGALPIARALRLAPAPPPGGWQRGITYRDIRRPFPEADGTVAAIYSSHVLEHLEEPEARRVLGEMARVLAPGGLLRLVLPDAEVLVRGYLNALEQHDGAAEPPIDRLSRNLMVFGGWTDGHAGSLGRFYMRSNPKHLHKWLYDRVSLEQRLRAVGFSDIRPTAMGESVLDDIDAFETEFPYPNSVFLDAIR